MDEYSTIFIDGGSHWGEGFDEIRSNGLITLPCKVFMFEPNFVAFSKLKHSIEHKRWGDYDITLSDSPLYDRVQSVTFRMQTDAYGEKDGTTSTLIPSNEFSIPIHGELIERTTIDTSDFIRDLYETYVNGKAHPPKIIMKLDVEGAEYAILCKMINTGTIRFIDRLIVEFHSKFVPGHAETERYIRRSLKELNINWSEWK
jgi:FkbM family methyltransferase